MYTPANAEITCKEKEFEPSIATAANPTASGHFWLLNAIDLRSGFVRCCPGCPHDGHVAGGISSPECCHIVEAAGLCGPYCWVLFAEQLTCSLLTYKALVCAGSKLVSTSPMGSIQGRPQLRPKIISILGAKTEPKTSPLYLLVLQSRQARRGLAEATPRTQNVLAQGQSDA